MMSYAPVFVYNTNLGGVFFLFFSGLDVILGLHTSSAVSRKLLGFLNTYDDASASVFLLMVTTHVTPFNTSSLLLRAMLVFPLD
jgi:hypothetical protein